MNFQTGTPLKVRTCLQYGTTSTTNTNNQQNPDNSDDYDSYDDPADSTDDGLVDKNTVCIMIMLIMSYIVNIYYQIFLQF